jgi:hypothetical protein
MKLFLIIILIALVFLLMLFIYCACYISSECSRREEHEKEILERTKKEFKNIR